MKEILELSQNNYMQEGRSGFEEFIKFIKINHPLKGLIPFVVHDYLWRFFDLMENNRFVISIKFRQSGISTFKCLYGLWKAAQGKRAAIICNRVEDCEFMLEHIASLVGDKFKEIGIEGSGNLSGNLTIDFKSGGSFAFFPDEPFKGYAVDYLFIDEAAFLKDGKSTWKRSFPLFCGNAGSCVVTSTINGIGNWFADVYRGAESGLNNFKVFDVSYLDHPDYADGNLYKQLEEALKPEEFRQEVLGLFIGADEAKKPKEETSKDVFDQFIDGLTVEQTKRLVQVISLMT